MKKLAPIILFTYNRLPETLKSIKALQENYLAKESELFIFSDGPKNNEDEIKIFNIRKHLKKINGFKKVTLFESKNNIGLADSVISGITKIFDTHDRVIVLEDDLITSKNFLDFMNQALTFYDKNPKIISISGYTMNLQSLKTYQNDYYIGQRASSWGWATWKNQWTNVDWKLEDYHDFKNNKRIKRQFRKISSDMPGMLKNQMEGTIDSWAIRWCYHQFKYDLLTIFAAKSKVYSIGNGIDATHTVGVTKFDTVLDKSDRRQFIFEQNVKLDKKITQEFRAKFSVKRRAIDKLLKIIKNLKS